MVDLLLGKGYEVLGTDRCDHPDAPCQFVEVNPCDRDKVLEMMSKAYAVIHLGAILGPHGGEPGLIYENNGFSTYNIMTLMTLAAERSLRRVVFSSSAFAVGWAEDPRAFVPKYLPLDEDHPLTPFCSEILPRTLSRTGWGNRTRSPSISQPKSLSGCLKLSPPGALNGT